ncbi:stage V sporulation protein S [Candidatus Bipolaricaulota bacterium]|nr:stage V sporulation protein S [Candidatus Bipolaricaulota bacterium]
MNTLRVASHSDPSATAGAIANSVRETGEAEIQVIGPKAVNQAVKAIAIARGYVAASGVDLYCVPSFTNIQVVESNHGKTAIRFAVRPRHEMMCSSFREPRSEIAVES